MFSYFDHRFLHVFRKKDLSVSKIESVNARNIRSSAEEKSPFLPTYMEGKSECRRVCVFVYSFHYAHIERFRIVEDICLHQKNRQTRFLDLFYIKRARHVLSYHLI